MRSVKASYLSSQQLSSSWEDIGIIAPVILFLSLLVGVCFYTFANDWDVSLSYYFAASVLLGDMYLVPTEPNPWSSVFTLFYFLWGTTLLAGAITAAANMIVNSAMRIAAEERKRIFSATTGLGEDDGLFDEEGKKVVVGGLARLLVYFQWSKYRSKYLALFCALGWLCVGILYGICYEEWDYIHAILFAIAAVSTAGNMPPPCIGIDATRCTLGPVRSIFLGTYIIIGVPIFAYTVGQFAEILVERAIRANEMRLMCRPLTEQEFRFAYELHRGEIVIDNSSNNSSAYNSDSSNYINPPYSSDNEDDADGNARRSRYHRNRRQSSVSLSSSSPSYLSLRRAFQRQHARSELHVPPRCDLRLNLEDFIILEMLRLQKITSHDLQYIKCLFDSLDEDGDGVILSQEPMPLPMPASASRATSSNTPSPLHSITSNQNAFSTPVRKMSLRPLSASSSEQTRYSNMAHYPARHTFPPRSTPIVAGMNDHHSSALYAIAESDPSNTDNMGNNNSVANVDTDTDTVIDVEIDEHLQQQQQREEVTIPTANNKENKVQISEDDEEEEVRKVDNLSPLLSYPTSQFPPSDTGSSTAAAQGMDAVPVNLSTHLSPIAVRSNRANSHEIAVHSSEEDADDDGEDDEDDEDGEDSEEDLDAMEGEGDALEKSRLLLLSQSSQASPLFSPFRGNDEVNRRGSRSSSQPKQEAAVRRKHRNEKPSKRPKKGIKSRTERKRLRDCRRMEDQEGGEGRVFSLPFIDTSSPVADVNDPTNGNNDEGNNILSRAPMSILDRYNQLILSRLAEMRRANDPSSVSTPPHPLAADNTSNQTADTTTRSQRSHTLSSFFTSALAAVRFGHQHQPHQYTSVDDGSGLANNRSSTVPNYYQGYQATNGTSATTSTRSRRATTESSLRPVIQLRSFRKQPEGKRRLSGGSWPEAASAAITAAAAIAGEANSSRGDATADGEGNPSAAMFGGGSKVVGALYSPTTMAVHRADWSIGDWIDLEQSRRSSVASTPQHLASSSSTSVAPPATSVVNERTALLPSFNGGDGAGATVNRYLGSDADENV